MTKYNSILVPIDGSDNAKRALEQAVDLATTYGASITLAYVAHDIAPLANFDQISTATEYVKEHLPQDMEKEGQVFLDGIAKTVPESVPVKSVFAVGSPGSAIVEAAKDGDFDLIVMGSRGLGPLKGLFLGSVSSYVVTRAGCSVLIVK